MSDQPRDLTDGWPSDPENPELAQFADQLQRALPQLPDASLERVGARVRNEAVALPPRRRHWLRAGLAAAAILLLAVVWKAPQLLHPPAEHPAEAWVTDTFPVKLARPPAAIAPDRPLVRLEENQSLFTD